MTNNITTILSKIDKPPYGIRLTDGSWQLCGHSINTQDHLFSSMEMLISLVEKKKSYNERETCWNGLLSLNTAQYIRKHHPNFCLVDVSVACGFTIFSQIQAQNISSMYWKGGNAGSVQLDSNEAKRRTIAEVIERTFLSNIKGTIWASAVATEYAQAELYAKIESIERWVIMNWWKKNSDYKITEDLITHLPQEQRSVIDAVLFEWELYDGKVQCLKVVNPFGIEIALAMVDVFLSGRWWRFYGNGLDTTLIKAAEKACLETLQFIPGPCPLIFSELETSLEENDQRIFSWTNQPTDRLHFQPRIAFQNQGSMSDSCTECFDEKIRKAFQAIQLTTQITELQDCPGVFVAYVESDLNWRTQKGIPIV